MSEILKELRKDWWKIIIGLFGIYGAWIRLGYRVDATETRVLSLEKSSGECHDFMIGQKEINKTIFSLDKKIDRLLLRR